MGGTISATSTLGAGSLFTVTLPLRDARPQAAASTAPALFAERRAHLAGLEESGLRDSLTERLTALGVEIVATPDSGAVVFTDAPTSTDNPQIIRVWPRRLVVAECGSSPVIRTPIRREALQQALARALAMDRNPIVVQPTLPTRRWQRVLIVEDNAINRRIASLMLAPLAETVDIAVDGREAVRRAADAKYDLILMDLQMPGMDGIAATHAIRLAEQQHGRPRTRIVALTANSMSDDRQACLAAGMDGFLAKPLRREDLLNL